MPIQTSLVDIPFTGGVDETTRQELVAPPSFARLVNLRQIKRGSYQKRPGNATLGTPLGLSGSAIPQGKRLLGIRDELCMTDGLNVYSHGLTNGRWKKATGLAPQASITNQPVIPLQFGVAQYDIASLNGYYVVAAMLPDSSAAAPTWTGFGNVIDAATGAVITSPAVFMNGVSNTAAPPFVMTTVGTKVVCVWADVANFTNDIFYSYIDLASPATIANGWHIVGGALITNYVAPGAGRFDACSLGSTFAIAYVNTNVGSNANTITVSVYDASFVIQVTSTVAASPVGFVSPGAVSCAGASGDVLFVAWGSNGSTLTKVIGLNPSSLSITATAATVITVAGTTANVLAVSRTATGVGWLVCSDNKSNANMYSRAFSVAAGAITVTGSTFLQNAHISPDSRPFVANGRVYCTIRPSSAANQLLTSNDLLVADLTQSVADRFGGITQGYLRIAGHVSPRLAFAPLNVAESVAVNNSNSTCTHAVAVSATKAVFLSATLKNATSSSLDLVTMDWGATCVAQPSITGELLAMAGSPPSVYDGVRSNEMGFFSRPTIVSDSTSGIIGPDAGTYLYIAVYEQIDALGNWHQSNISDPYSVTASGSDGIVLVVSTLQMTNRADVNNTVPASSNDVRVALYRTKASGTVYFRMSGAANYVIVANNPIAATVTFPTDTTADADLRGAPLYSQPGIPGVALVKVTPPSFSAMIAHGDRLMGANVRTVWFSGQKVYGEAPWWADNFQFNVDVGGDITALASMDGALIIFKRNAVAIVDGQGPPDNGSGGDYGPPQFVPTDVGCIEPRSVVVTAIGTMFQSSRGIELLTRSRQVAPYFGSPVEDSLAANPVITSAVLDNARSQVTFTCIASEGASTGITVNWDLLFNVWTTGTLTPGSPSDNQAAWSAIMWGQNPGTVPIRSWLDSGGIVYQESTTDYSDAGTWVDSIMETAWIRIGSGSSGAFLSPMTASFQMAVGAILQAQSLTGHDLTISVGYDYASSYTDTHTWTAAEIAAFTTNRETLQFDLTRPECIAFRIKAVDATPSSGTLGTSQGVVLFGLLADGGTNGKFVPLPEENRK